MRDDDDNNKCNLSQPFERVISSQCNVIYAYDVREWGHEASVSVCIFVYVVMSFILTRMLPILPNIYCIPWNVCVDSAVTPHHTHNRIK